MFGLKMENFYFKKKFIEVLCFLLLSSLFIPEYKEKDLDLMFSRWTTLVVFPHDCSLCSWPQPFCFQLLSPSFEEQEVTILRKESKALFATVHKALLRFLKERR